MAASPWRWTSGGAAWVPAIARRSMLLGNLVENAICYSARTALAQDRRAAEPGRSFSEVSDRGNRHIGRRAAYVPRRSSRPDRTHAAGVAFRHRRTHRERPPRSSRHKPGAGTTALASRCRSVMKRGIPHRETMRLRGSCAISCRRGTRFSALYGGARSKRGNSLPPDSAGPRLPGGNVLRPVLRCCADGLHADRLMLTARSEKPTSSRPRLGAETTITKPFHLQELLARIQPRCNGGRDHGVDRSRWGTVNDRRSARCSMERDRRDRVSHPRVEAASRYRRAAEQGRSAGPPGWACGTGEKNFSGLFSRRRSRGPVDNARFGRLRRKIEPDPPTSRLHPPRARDGIA